MEKVLIYENAEKARETEKHYSAIASNCNAVISAFNNYQPYMAVDMPKTAFEVVSDPVKAFDSAILKGCGIKGVTDPEAAAKLFGIDRPGFVQGITLHHIPGIGIPAYQQSKAKKVFSYNGSSPVIKFVDGSFIVDETELNALINATCKIFAENAEETAVYNQWNAVCSTINKHLEKLNVHTLPCGPVPLGNVFGLDYVPGTSPAQFKVNPEKIAQEIRAMRQPKTEKA